MTKMDNYIDMKAAEFGNVAEAQEILDSIGYCVHDSQMLGFGFEDSQAEIGKIVQVAKMYQGSELEVLRYFDKALGRAAASDNSRLASTVDQEKTSLDHLISRIETFDTQLGALPRAIDEELIADYESHAPPGPGAGLTERQTYGLRHTSS